ncbi:MAG: RNA recognition motif domain-containing protein [Candidatus Binatia bacterium]
MTKLFVGNLPFSATNEALEALFEQAGTVASVDILTDRQTGRSRGFGFVEMNNQQEAEDAINRFNGYEMQGRALTVNIAKPREDRGGGGGGGGRRSFGGGGDRKFGGRSGGDGGRDRRW